MADLREPSESLASGEEAGAMFFQKREWLMCPERARERGREVSLRSKAMEETRWRGERTSSVELEGGLESNLGLDLKQRQVERASQEGEGTRSRSQRREARAKGGERTSAV